MLKKGMTFSGIWVPVPTETDTIHVEKYRTRNFNFHNTFSLSSFRQNKRRPQNIYKPNQFLATPTVIHLKPLCPTIQHSESMSSVATAITAFSNSSPTLPSISLHAIPSKPSVQTLSPPSSFSSLLLYEDSLTVAAAAQAFALANAAAQAARDAVSLSLTLTQMAFPEVHDLPLEKDGTQLPYSEPKSLPAAVARKRRKKRRRLSESIGADLSSSSTLCFSSSSGNSRYLTPKEEADLTVYLKEGARLEAVRKRIRETRKFDPTMSQWAEAAGMKRGSLDKIIWKAKMCREKISLSHKRLIVTVATPYLGRGLSLHDLIQEGTIGLLKGVERFDRDKGCKLSTYVYWWIKQAIIKAIATKSRIIRLPGSMRGSVARIAEANNSLRRELGRWPTYNEIAEAADLGVSSVRLVRDRTRHPISLDQPVSNQGSITLKEIIPGPEETIPEAMVTRQQMKRDLDRLLKTLDQREEHILRLYFGLNGETARSCEEIGRLINLSRERVRQIRCIALSKLQKMSIVDSLKAYVT